MIDHAGGDAAGVEFRQYQDESDLAHVQGLVDPQLSEPYSVFTYRYFLAAWPHLCFMAFAPDPSGGGPRCIGCVVCKQDVHRCSGTQRGYVAMLVVHPDYRHARIGTSLVARALGAMQAAGAEEVVLEAEATNAGALRLYARLGFVRDKRLARYYLSGSDAYRLKLLLPVADDRLVAEAGTAGVAG